jgi:hypothetical protein
MSESEMVCKYCNLRKRNAAFELAMEGSFEDNLRILGFAGLKCLDIESCCNGLGCIFAKGSINPFCAPA